ncbi:MAG: hypothetical protein DRO94_04885 [Candidatus Altiarchaeales archaeon]|nr:MAG: hypothetical protein DRO95_04050 [Candidatus Altiarchaeales archaeon]RLI93578.1 MAG: hypothetical protein DRO94_04885 [Candidatus Altiarchaeales archaeon]HDO82446.1 sugar phosphate isomerase/epimerase [Candidatus Altiarchaeales archaeon]HEX55095.1 sugar phosphate isomerase/epimerase [Candidatus Altiarchaeales archaeon]
MELGISTQIFWNYQELDLEYAITHSVNDLCFKCVEIHCQSPMFRGWGTSEGNETKKSLKDILSTLDVELSLHAPYHDLNIATLNLGIRREVIKQLKECINMAHFLNSNIVVVHPGFVASRKYRRETAFNYMIDGFKEITRVAEDLSVNVCMENIASKPKAMGVHIPEIIEIYNSINSENFKICLDASHANTTGIRPEHYAKELREYVAHVHVSDNTGSDQHMPIGMGNIDFESFLRNLRPYKGFVVIEGWIPRNQDYFIEWDKKQLEEIISRI